jgi:two-component system OmpR family response regulator
MRLLLIEDDLQAAEYLCKGLRESGYSVEHSPDGRDGLDKAGRGRWDVIIADRQLPYVDGLAIITSLRERSDRTPVLILSALGTVDDRVHGLKAGGDDYLTKPFAFAELLARIEALNRRGAAASETTRLKIADLELDLLARRVTRAGRNIELTTRNSSCSSTWCVTPARQSRAPCCWKACGTCISIRRPTLRTCT